MHPLYWTGVPLLPRERICIFNQQIYFIIFFRYAAQFQFIPLQNVVYFITLTFLVCKIFIVYINDVLNFKCPAPKAKGLIFDFMRIGVLRFTKMRGEKKRYNCKSYWISCRV